MDYILSVDIGTQGTKAAVYDRNLKVFGTGFCESRVLMSQERGIWQEPEELYQSVLTSIRQAVAASGIPAGEIGGVGIDSQMAGIMGIDEKGDPVTVYDSWLDTRCKKYVKLMEQEAEERIIEITGSPISYAHGPKILWWKHEAPDIYKKIKKFVLPHVFVVNRMTGKQGKDTYLDYTCIQYSGFGDNKKKCWSGELLETFGIEADKLPEIVSPFETAGYLSKQAADFCGLKQGIPIAAGAGDTAASVFGAGLFGEGIILDCAGTASVLCSMVKQYRPDSRHKTMVMMRAPIDGQWYPLAYISGGGLCIRWMRDLFDEKSYEELEKEAGKLPAGSDGLIFVPHFEGRVFPHNPYMRGSFTGLHWGHTKGHMYRAVLEGIACEYKYYQSVLKELFPEYGFDQVWATGGGARSPLFLSIKSQMLKAKVTAFEQADTALIGSAAVAGISTGMIRDYEKVIGESRKVKQEYAAETGIGSGYEAMQREYLETMEALSEIYKKRRDLL